MTDALKPAKLELQAAAKSIAEMRSAKSLVEFETAWRAFLNCLEKAWLKAERCCEPVRAQFQPWQGTYHRLRKKDMLLRYLKQARDADNHSIQDVAKIEPGSRGIRFANRQGGYIKKLTINNGQITHYEGDPIVVEDKPPTVVAVPVKNSGAWYNPPTSHLDRPVTSQHPLHLSELGLKFYEEYIHAVQDAFFSEKKP
jgi:hypothetical protein